MCRSNHTHINLHSPNTTNLLNLKQFRDAGDSELACYQALVNARMLIRKYNGSALLGETALRYWRV